MQGIPFLFAEKITRDPEIMNIFAALPLDRQKAIIEKARGTTDSFEMGRIINEIKQF